MSIYWKTFCTDEQSFVYVWSDTLPTECPNSSLHSIYDFTDIDREEQVLRINNIFTSKTDVYTRALLFQYNSNTLGLLRRIKAIIYCDGTTTNFDVKLMDITNKTVLLETNCTNTNPTIMVDLGVVSSSPTDECILELQIRRGNGGGNIYLYECIVYRGLLS